MAKFKNLVVNGKHAKFEIHDVDLAIANGLRRIGLAELPHIAVASDMSITENDSALHNEILTHRLSLLALHFPPEVVESYDPSNYCFELYSRNDGPTPIDVTTADITITDAAEAPYPPEFHTHVFPPYESPEGKEYYPLIATLKTGQSMRARFTGVRGIAKEHARWSPLSCCTFQNLDDAPVVAVERAKITGAHELNYFDTLGKQRLFMKDKYGEPCAFLFKLESESAYSPCGIFENALKVLAEKVQKCIDNFESVQHDVMENGMHVYTFIGEDHTLGNLLQSIAYNRHSRLRGDGAVEYVGYYVPHPLTESVVLKLRPSEDDAKEAMDQLMAGVLEDVLQQLQKMRNKFRVFAKDNM
jgi:DNA-directed RNA polymerase subunit L